MRAGSCAVAILALLGSSAWGAAGDVLMVTGSSVNVRAGPSTDAAVEMQVDRDQRVIEIAREGEWVRAEIVGTSGEEGWIHTSLLAPARDTSAPGALPQQDPARTAALPGTNARTAPLTPEPAMAPGEIAGLQRFRESVEYLNSRAVQVAGVSLFTDVQPAGAGVVQVTTTKAWSTVPPAGQRSYLNTLADRWAAARQGGGPGSVQIVDPSGNVVAQTETP